MTTATPSDLEALWDAVAAADQLPYGSDRCARLEHAVRRADEMGSGELGVAARVALMESYGYGGQAAKQFEPFGWLLARYDESPGWFTERERVAVLWTFRWVTTELLDYPEVPLELIASGIEQMASRYRSADAGEEPVLHARFLLMTHLHGAAAAQREYLRWLAAPRTELSDCAECAAATRVTHLAELGRHQDAIAEALPVLDQHDTCPDQPQRVIGAVLESMLAFGDAERAATEHLRGVRLLRGADLHDNGHPGHLLACARSGRMQRGLELLQEWLPGLAGNLSPGTRLRYSAAAARLLTSLIEAGAADLVVGGTDERSVAELHEELTASATQLAADFDIRNGTPTMGDAVRRTLTAGPLPDLPLGWLGRSRRSARVPDTGPAAAADQPPEPPGGSAPLTQSPAALAAAGDVAGLSATLDAASQAEDDGTRLATLEAWRRIRGPALAAGPSLAAARLEAWLSVEDLLSGRLEEPPAMPPASGGEPGAGTPVPDRTAGVLGAAIPDEPLAKQADRAAELLRAAGAPVEALLHLQAALLAAEQSGRIERVAAAELMAALAAEVVRIGPEAEVGVALTRLVIARHVAGIELAAEPDAGTGTGPPGMAALERFVHPVGPDGEPGAFLGAATALADDVAAVIADPLTAGILALEEMNEAELGHQQRRSLARLLRIKASELQLEDAVGTLRRAVEVLPDGVRPLERALAGADLADALQQLEPDAALAAWQRAGRDAAAARHDGLLGQVLAAAGSWRHATGDAAGAVADLAAAIPLLDEHAMPMLGAQARFDLARALLDDQRTVAAVELAEATLTDLTELLAAEGVTAAGPDDPEPSADEGLGSGEVHLAGCAAFAAAEAAMLLGELANARELAALSAGWHRRNGNLIAEAESWQLAARAGTGDPAGTALALARAAELAEAGGDWARAATCRREQAAAVNDLSGPAAALELLTEATEHLELVGDAPAGRHSPPEVAEQARRQLTWHRYALREQRARVLAVAGRYQEALAAVDGLEGGYRELGDDWSARDLLGLRGQVVAELGDIEAGIVELRAAAEEALAEGDAAQAQGLGSRLAAVLDDAGRREEAEHAWRQFAGHPD